MNFKKLTLFEKLKEPISRFVKNKMKPLNLSLYFIYSM